jgi:hypothetical protein
VHLMFRNDHIQEIFVPALLKWYTLLFK